MLLRQFRLFVIFALVLTGCFYCCAQSAENRIPTFSKDDEDKDKNNQPKNLKETLEKMRIEKEKKEFNEMIARGEEALKISEQLEKAFEANGKLTEKEVVKLANVEKIVKKIRSELGGDDEADSDEQARSQGRPISLAAGIKSLRSTTVTLFDELKKTTRFTISAAAIQSSNAVLRLARFLRITN